MHKFFEAVLSAWVTFYPMTFFTFFFFLPSFQEPILPLALVVMYIVNVTLNQVAQSYYSKNDSHFRLWMLGNYYCNFGF